MYQYTLDANLQMSDGVMNGRKAVARSGVNEGLPIPLSGSLTVGQLATGNYGRSFRDPIPLLPLQPVQLAIDIPEPLKVDYKYREGQVAEKIDVGFKLPDDGHAKRVTALALAFDGDSNTARVFPCRRISDRSAYASKVREFCEMITGPRRTGQIAQLWVTQSCPVPVDA